MTQPATILALLARPLVDRWGRPVGRLGLEAEVSRLREQMGHMERAAALYVDIAEPERVLALLTKRSFDLLHFSGHGGQDSLIFENQAGEAMPLKGDTLRRVLFPGGRVPFRLAFLSACHSESAAKALLDAGIPHVVVIAAAEGVADLAAAAFARHFYPALLAGHTVAQAVEIGRTGVRVDTDLDRIAHAIGQPDRAALEEARFLLLPENGNHNQVLFPDLPVAPPTVSWPQSTPHNLGPRLETFTGRESELHAVLCDLSGHRLVTITGFGGIGKTELAKEAGRWLAERGRFPAGITFVDLREVADAAVARLRIVTACGLDPQLAGSQEALAAVLGKEERLLILDDLDMLVAAERRGVRALLQALLEGGNGLRLLLTTREAAGHLPEKVRPLGRLAPDQAARLFVSWALLGRDDLPGSEEELLAVLQFLDGYPLAIRLAASLLRRTDLRSLLRDLEAERERALRDPALTAEEQDKLTSVEFSLGLSEQRLRQSEPRAARLFPLLALFPGGADVATLEAVLGKVAGGLPVLRDISLVEMEGERARLPGPARAYAARRLPPGAADVYGPAALDHYLALVERADELLGRAEHRRGMGILVAELPNLRFWLDWGLAQEKPEKGISRAARLAGRLRNFYMLLSWPAEAEDFFRRGSKAAHGAGDRLGEAYTLRAIGDVQRFRDENDAALASYEQALALFRAVGSRLGEANVYGALSRLLVQQGNIEEGEKWLEQAVALHQGIGSRYDVAVDWGNFARVLFYHGHNKRACIYARRAEPLFRALGHPAAQAMQQIIAATCET